MKNLSKILYISSITLLLVSCGETTSSSTSGKDTTIDTPDVSSTDTEVQNNPIHVDTYVADVSATLPILKSGKLQGEDVDYVVSSYPVIFSAMSSTDKTTDLSIYSNVAEDFGKKYNTSGFPQAGLFIKSSLLENSDNNDNILSFLKAFDEATLDLVNGGQKAVDYINAYDTDTAKQQQRFGYAAGVIKNVQKTNGLAFLSNEQNPSINELKGFKDSLNVDIEEELVSNQYKANISEEVKAADELNFNVVAPMGAPNAALAKFASSDKLTLTAPANVSASLVKGEADFIIFDSVNALKLSKQNNSNYKLVRMVTYGNLYIVATGNDDNNELDDSDNIVSYGEGLVPDIAFKATYGE